MKKVFQKTDNIPIWKWAKKDGKIDFLLSKKFHMIEQEKCKATAKIAEQKAECVAKKLKQ